MVAVRLGMLAVLLAGAGLAGATSNFIVYSAPVKLRYGQVHNLMQAPMDLPKDIVDHYADGKKLLAVTGFDVDMVRLDADGTEFQVKLSDHYLHHYILQLGNNEAMRRMFDAVSEDVHVARMLSGCHGMTHSGLNSFTDRLRKQVPSLGGRLKVFGSAAGAEYRHNPQRFLTPYRMLLEKPQVWTPVLHIINTNRPNASKLPWSPLLECPCTPQRKIDVANNTIDGRSPDPRISCSPEFAATGNPSCHLSTYVGGWRCCEHEIFVIDTSKECSDPQCSEEPVDEVRVKYTFYYEDAQPGVRDIEGAACCDVTSVTKGDENIEYDIPKCPEGTPREKCFHVAESVQPLAYFSGHTLSPDSTRKPSDMVDLVFAAPHLHLAGQSLQLIDNVTNEVLCEVHANADNTGGIKYGNGTSPGNEDGYLVGMSTCSWDGKQARQYRRDHPMRSRAVYNADRSHTGVMSLWLMQVSSLEPDILI
mmetsp:Transcript_70055/g.197732  ORF Transcript_70055/g.197732 Transcript_70055/m.197732 type:complete len:476 (-) Transcript_70055:266-1693(-)